DRGEVGSRRGGAVVVLGGGGDVAQGIGSRGGHHAGEDVVRIEFEGAARLGAGGGGKAPPLGEQRLGQGGVGPSALRGGAVLAPGEVGLELARGRHRLARGREGAGLADLGESPSPPLPAGPTEGRLGAAMVTEFEPYIAQLPPQLGIGGPQRRG